MYRDFVKVGQEFSHSNDFAFVYIEEAHASDEWPISSSRYTPDNQIVSVEQPKLASERVKLAQRFVRTFGLGTEMKVLVDDPQNGNQFEAAYGKNMTFVFCLRNAFARCLFLQITFFLKLHGQSGYMSLRMESCN